MTDLLFYNRGDLRTFLEKRKIDIKKEIASHDINYLLNVSEVDFCNYLVDRYAIEPSSIKEEEIYVQKQDEIDIDVSQDLRRAVINRNRSVYVKGVSVTIAAPFEGYGELFNYKPSTFTFNPPRGVVVGNEVHLTIKGADLSSEQVKSSYIETIKEINKYLEYVNNDISSFNSHLEGYIKQVVSQRKKKLLDNQGLVASLGIPIKAWENTPTTYVVPEIRRKPKIQAPKVTTKGFKPEPVLDIKEYENILNIIQDMVLVMERSPKAFVNMGEEDIRQQLLVPLNGQYEGRATGETFNYKGKTDILIREDNKNIFIAECKFWKGEKELLKAIDQLLGYTSWRDTKAALIIFNRNKEFSAVLEKINPAIKIHTCFKREMSVEGETTFRYVLHQPEDKNREIVLTVLAFNIPEQNASDE